MNFSNNDVGVRTLQQYGKIHLEYVCGNPAWCEIGATRRCGARSRQDEGRALRDGGVWLTRLAIGFPATVHYRPIRPTRTI